MSKDYDLDNLRRAQRSYDSMEDPSFEGIDRDWKCEDADGKEDHDWEVMQVVDIQGDTYVTSRCRICKEVKTEKEE